MVDNLHLSRNSPPEMSDDLKPKRYDQGLVRIRREPDVDVWPSGEERPNRKPDQSLNGTERTANWEIGLTQAKTLGP